MIQLEHLHIEDFRGIRLIDLPLGSKSFAVHGPNGSGKSGVVDAIDFALTGVISRLAGAGTGGVTLLKHGPHVSKRDDPSAAIVKLTVKDVDSGETAVLTRNIKAPNKVLLDPDTPAMRAAIAEAQAHPELTLSRREIIKYVVSKPADRASEVQALLKLNRLDEYRKLLRSALTKTSTELTSATNERESAETSFLAHLDTPKLLVGEIARIINAHRSTLGLMPVEAVTIDTDFAEGLTVEAVTRSINLATALRESKELNEYLAAVDDIEQKRTNLNEALQALVDDPTLLDSLKHRQMVEVGLAALDSSSCPLCDTEWADIKALREHLTTKLERSNEAQALRQQISTVGDAYKQVVNALREKIGKVIASAESYGDAELPHELRTWSATLLTHVQSLGATADTIIAARTSLSTAAYAAPAGVVKKLATLEDRISKEPDQSATDAARTFLTVAKDRWGRARTARAQEAKAIAVRDTAQTIYTEYSTVSDDALKGLYSTVEADFSRFYSFINSDDEKSFRAILTPATGSLGLEVDFYDKGKFPPTAYHSEGHQDGMGVCLYLALVKQLLGENFRYAVLDDVVMSVDVNHRRQFCELLKKEFPDVQFIITTHDEVWARQMQTASLVTSKAQARFYGWTVDGGPVYEQGNIWERIDEDLAKDDVAGAALKLRMRLEAAAGDIAETIGGRVAYRGDGNYDPSDFLSAIKGRYSDLLKMAADSASSWNNKEAQAAVEEKKQARAKIVPEQEDESWLVNALVHNNDWANASVNDFKPVLKASREFLGLFMCDNPECGSWIKVLGRPEKSLECDCGKFNLNLKKKKK